MSLEEKLRRVAGWAGVLVSILGLVALAGWIFGFDALKSFRPTTAPMKANTALCLVLAGAALWLYHRGRFPRAGFVCAALVGIFAGASAIESIFHLNFGVDELLVKD